jgi:UDP-glucose 4-epimerase
MRPAKGAAGIIACAVAAPGDFQFLRPDAIMTILVTGGAGYIGSHVVLALLDAGETVVVLDDLSTGFVAAVPAAAAFCRGNCGDGALVSGLIAQHGVTSIVHLAAKLIVSESVAEPLHYYENNCSHTRTLIECAVRLDVRNFVFSSSAAVYGEAMEEPVAETAPLRPVSPYGRSKLISEWMLEDAARASGLRFACLRYFNVAGADPLGRAGQNTRGATLLIKVAVEAALGRRNGLTVHGADYPTSDGTCVRDYVQVSDLAQAHVDALNHLRGGGASGPFNCGYGTGYSVLDVIKAVKTVSGVDFPVQISGRRAGDPAIIVADPSLIRRTIGWEPRYGRLEDIITQALDWERSLVEPDPALRDRPHSPAADQARRDLLVRAARAKRDTVFASGHANDDLPAGRGVLTP